MIQLYKPWTFIKYLWILKQDSTTSDLLGMGNKIGFFLLFFLLLLFLVLWSFFAVYLLLMFVPIIFPTTSEHKSRGYLIALPKEKKSESRNTLTFYTLLVSKNLCCSDWLIESNLQGSFLRLIIKMKFIYNLTSEFKKIKINGKRKWPHIGHISHLTVLFFVLSALNKYEWKKKKKSWNILQELWVFFPYDCLNSLFAFSQCKINSL